MKPIANVPHSKLRQKIICLFQSRDDFDSAHVCASFDFSYSLEFMPPFIHRHYFSVFLFFYFVEVNIQYVFLLGAYCRRCLVLFNNLDITAYIVIGKMLWFNWNNLAYSRIVLRKKNRVQYII